MNHLKVLSMCLFPESIATIKTIDYYEIPWKITKADNGGQPPRVSEMAHFHPELDQVDIMRELKQLGDLPPEVGGGNILDSFDWFKPYDKVVETYEEVILDQKLVTQFAIIAEEALTKHVQQMRRTHPNLREHVIEAILNKAPNADLMRRLSQKLIELEKMDNSYDPENWKQLPEA